MTARRAHARAARPNVHPTAAPGRLLSSHTFTLIASWRGQLLICTVVLIFGAIYFVIREPIRQWRRRQRERISRAFTEELLAAEKKAQPSAAVEEKDRAGPSTATSTATPKTITARERGREKRKEKKRLLAAASPGPSNSVSSLDSSPSLGPATSTSSGQPLERVPSKLQDSALPPPVPEETSAPEEESTSVHTINLESTPSSPATSPVQTSISPSPIPPSPLPQTSLVVDSPELLQDEMNYSESSDPPPSDMSRPSVSRTTSASYSIVPDDLYLPLTVGGKKKKHKSKARSRSNGSAITDLGKGPAQPMARNVTVSSDEVPSPASAASSASPHTPRRRRVPSQLGGMAITPALELLLTNHERTIDALRAEIGQSKAEESKAREDEARAREQLRHSRATEDRVRADYERSRKARDRAESDSRRLEAELMLSRSRFETLSHMYQAVCHRLRELEQAHGPDAGHSPQPPPQSTLHPPSPAMLTPHIGYPSPMGSPMPMGYAPFPQHHMYPSPLQAHGFANFVLSPSPHRRVDSTANGDVLAGPLTPGHAPSGTASQASSPYPSDLSLNPSSATPSSSATAVSDLSVAELRRINIASSVLKKKNRVPTDPSESGDSQPASTSKKSEVPDISEEDSTVDGLGIKQYDNASSTFPSVNVPSSPVSPRNPPTKQRSTDSISSDASSGPPGRSLLITPSDTGPKTPSPAATMSTVPDEEGTPSPVNGDTPCPSKPGFFHSLNEPMDLANGDAEFVPMFASLAHTPEQLQEIARLQSEALRNRGRTRPVA